MEPDTLNDFKTFLAKKLQQKFIVSDTDEELKGYINDYLDNLAKVDSLTKVDSLNSSIHDLYKDWLEQNEVKQFVLDDYIEEIEDIDLGLVRKINLN